MSIREMQEIDLNAVVEIEQQAQIRPWASMQFLACLHNGYKAFVLEIEEEIIGYIILSIIVPEAEILTVAIKPEQQKSGYGYKLLQFLLQLAHKNAVKQIFLEVRRSNLAAICCYEKVGFKKIAERKNYYMNEDALIYRIDLDL